MEEEGSSSSVWHETQRLSCERVSRNGSEEKDKHEHVTGGSKVYYESKVQEEASSGILPGMSSPCAEERKWVRIASSTNLKSDEDEIP